MSRSCFCPNATEYNSECHYRCEAMDSSYSKFKVLPYTENQFLQFFSTTLAESFECSFLNEESKQDLRH